MFPGGQQMANQSTNPDDYQNIPRPVAVLAKECGDTVSPWHSHKRGQLMYGSSGIIVASSHKGTWVLPERRAAWFPPGAEHTTRTIGPVAMRTVFVDPQAASYLPAQCCMVQVSLLLRGLILRAATLPTLYDESGADGRIMQLILDEIKDSREQPLSLPIPSDPRIAKICSMLLQNPRCSATLHDFAERAHASSRTIERAFHRATGMTFGEWRQEARLLSALTCLAAGKSVKEAAFISGYTSQGAFTNMFGRVLGTAPSRYFSHDDSDSFSASRKTTVGGRIGRRNPSTPHARSRMDDHNRIARRTRK